MRSLLAGRIVQGADFSDGGRLAALISRLHCPYCGGAFDAGPWNDGGDRSGAAAAGPYGLLRCECAEFPVVEGIPVLQHISGLERVVRHLRDGNRRGAFLAAMNVFRVQWARHTRLHQMRYRLNCRRLTNATLTFEDALRLVRKPTVFADYLLHRWANPSFLADVSLMPLLGSYLQAQEATTGGPSRARVLDLGSGAGHSSFLISALFPRARVTASDQDFVSLYLAKRFLAPSADYVCTDVEAPSPFPSSSFDVVHCLDAFHYFRSKRAIIGELRRVIADSGFWMFPHLHNALQENVTPGMPLSPQHYARCFDFIDPVILDEGDVLRHRSDISEAHRYVGDLDALRRAPALALVGGGYSPVGRSQALVDLLCQPSVELRINPIYKGRWSGRSLSLELRWPNAKLQEECRVAEGVLPNRCEVTREDLERAHSGRGADDPRLRDLVSSFVLVPLPAGYSRCDLTAASRGGRQR